MTEVELERLEGEKKDGYRVLVDSTWPEGVARSDLEIEDWRNELSPSIELRDWFRDNPENWDVFRERYFTELEEKREEVEELVEEAGERLVLVHTRRERRPAEALEQFIEGRVVGD